MQVLHNKLYTSEGKTSVGRSRKRWLGDIENDMKKMGVRLLEKNS
jgi:hypothetical protein